MLNIAASPLQPYIRLACLKILHRSSALQRRLLLSCDTNFPTINNPPFATVQVVKAGPPPFKCFRSHFAQLQEPEDTTEGSFLSYTQLVIITAGRKLTGVFQQKLFFFYDLLFPIEVQVYFGPCCALRM